MKLTLPNRLAVHSTLIACSVAFLFPFVWLVMTSLKPIEQTMTMPPQWLPRAYYATVQGGRLEVVKQQQFLPKPVVLLEEGPWEGERVVVPASCFRDGEAEVQVELAKTLTVADPSDGGEVRTRPRSVKSTETCRFRAKKVGEVFEPRVLVRVEEGRRKGERVLLPGAKYRGGLAEVAVRIGDREEVQRARATLVREVSKGDWLVRERINRLAAEPAALLVLTPDDIRDWRGLCSGILQERAAALPSPGQRLWGLLAEDAQKPEGENADAGGLSPPDARQLIEGIASGSDVGEQARSDVVDALNRLLQRRDLHREKEFAGLTLPAEAAELLERDREALTGDELQRLNRLLLEAAYPKAIRSTQSQRYTPRQDIVPAADIEERIQPAWWNYEGAIRYTGYYRLSLFGLRLDIPMFLLYTWNTLVVAVLGVIGTVLSNALVAYGFARIRWRGRETCFLITLSTMMVPFAVTMVPLYGVFRALGWIGSLKPLWVPAFLGSAFNIFLLRQFFMTIPEDLSDAARIDGCTEWGIFWRILLPLSKPALAVVALFHFMWAWKDFMGPLIFLRDQQTYTLSLGLQFYQSQHGGSEWHYLMAAATLMVLPVILLFFFTQRTFIQGISTTGMKG